MKKPAKNQQRSATKADKEMGKRIRVRRVEMKVSQAQLGHKLGVSFQQIQKYEKGVNRVGAGRMGDIAAALDVPITFFYDDSPSGEMEVQSLLYSDPRFTLRLLRAYNAIENIVLKRHFVTLMEGVAGIGAHANGG